MINIYKFTFKLVNPHATYEPGVYTVEGLTEEKARAKLKSAFKHEPEFLKGAKIVLIKKELIS